MLRWGSVFVQEQFPFDLHHYVVLNVSFILCILDCPSFKCNIKCSTESILSCIENNFACLYGLCEIQLGADYREEHS